MQKPVYLTAPAKGSTFVKNLVVRHHGLTGEGAESFAVHRWGFVGAQPVLKAVVGGLGTGDLVPDQGEAAAEFFLRFGRNPSSEGYP